MMKCSIKAMKHAALGLALVVGSASAEAKDKFVYGVPSVISSAISNFVFAQELGYFDEENIDLDYVPVSGSGVSIPLLLSNQIQTTSASLEPLTLSRAPGKQNFPLIFTYNVVRNSSWEFVVLDDSPIKTVKDLRNKNIGIAALTVGNVYMTRAIMRSEGIATNEMNFLPVGFGVQAFEALKTRQIDMLNLWDTMHATLQATGTKVRWIEFPKPFQELSSHGLLYTRKMIDEQPGLIARFGRAMSKGTVACEAEPRNCLRAFFKRYPNLRPAGTATEEAAIEKELPILMSRLRNIAIRDPAKKKLYGAYEDRDWDILIDALKLGEQLPQDVKIPMDALYTNRFVPKYNTFDFDAVVSQAKAYR